MRGKYIILWGALRLACSHGTIPRSSGDNDKVYDAAVAPDRCGGDTSTVTHRGERLLGRNGEEDFGQKGTNKCARILADYYFETDPLNEPRKLGLHWVLSLI